jgi:hypothetical protein
MSPAVQRAGFRALGNASYKIKKGAIETVTELGGIETAIDAMRRFPARKSVQTNACLLLCNVACLKGSVARIAQNPDGIPAIVGAMKKFSDDSRIQLYGCSTLMQISKSKVTAHNEKIVQAGGLVVLAEAKTNHPNNQDIPTRVRTAMKHLFNFKE